MANIKRITIESDAICFGPMPEPDEEVFQHLTINSRGRVWLSRYCFGKGIHEYVLKSKTVSFIGNETAKKILDTVATYYGKCDEPRLMVTDVGAWSAEIVFDNEETLADNGSLISDDGALHQISEMIRTALNDKSIFAFDRYYDDEEE